MPDLFVITGSNGAGKSTVGNTYLPEYIRVSCEVFDGDKLFLQKQKALWKEGITAIKEAKKIAYKYVSDLFEDLVNKSLQANSNFAYEGHFTNEATWDIPKRFKKSGYNIHIIFLGLENTSLSESRVVNRVKQGGHYVQPSEVTANFYGNLEQLNKYFTLFDTVIIIDTSEPEHKILAYLENGKVRSSLSFVELPSWFINRLPSIYQTIIKA